MFERAHLPSPVSLEVRELVNNAARELQEAPAGKAALTPRQLLRISAALGESNIAVRDRAIFLVNFALGWRSSEVASLSLSSVKFRGHGVVLTLGASKTDQDGSERRFVGLPRGQRVLTCPVRALRAWLKIRGEWPGPLFTRVLKHGRLLEVGLSGLTINDRLKLALESIGVDPSSYGSHSFRAGCVTAAIENGSSEVAIMQRTGHKNIATLQRYVRPTQAFKYDPLKGVL